MDQNLSKIEFKTADGKSTNLANYAGKVLLLVNVASKCGLTPQYDALEKLFESHREQGLVVLGFPANNFAAQEPGTNAEIQEFCQLTFGVKFPVLAKISVKGDDQHPLYKKLTETIPTATKKSDDLKNKLAKLNLLSGGTSDIMWNFEKFLVNRKGEVVKRFAPDISPDDPMITEAVEELLIS